MRLALIEALEGRRLLTTYNPGDLDPRFDQDGLVITDLPGTPEFIDAIVVQSDGKVIAAGATWDANGHDYEFVVVRYNANGSLDSSFDGDGKVILDIDGGNDSVNDVLIDASGRIIAVGGASGEFAVARFLSNGQLDSSFGVGGKVVGTSAETYEAEAGAIDSSGRLVLLASGDTTLDVVRLLPNGAFDVNGFGRGDGDADGIARVDLSHYFWDVALQPDGKILVAGEIDAQFGLVRLETDGDLDSTFGNGGVVTTDLDSDDSSREGAKAVVVDPVGSRIIAAGLSYPGQAIVAYRLDGSLDTGFSGDGKLSLDKGSELIDLTLQADRKIIVVATSWYDQFQVMRFNTNGTSDTSFSQDGLVETGFPGGEAAVYAVAVQPDGKIVAAGMASERIALARYYDRTFTEDTTPPTASLQPITGLFAETGAPLPFVVDFTDDVAVLASSITSPHVRVVRPGGTSTVLAGIPRGPNNALVKADYQLTGPGPGNIWDAADNGVYTIYLEAGVVSDTAGNKATAKTLGTFVVDIKPDNAAPQATLSAQNVTVAGGTSYSFDVTYTDDVAINTATFHTDDVRVTGGGVSVLPVSIKQYDTSNGPIRTVTYTITPPGGSWDAGDNGTYAVMITGYSAVSDTSGKNVPPGDFGSFRVQINTSAPSAQLQAGNVSISGSPLYTFNVTYRDEGPMNVATIATGDARVTGPGGFDQVAMFVGLDKPDDGSPRLATYSVVPPGGAWDAADNGVYTVHLSPDHVFNTGGTAVPGGVLGSFTVNIGAVGGIPTARLIAATQYQSGGTAYEFNVEYSDDSAISRATIGNGDLLVFDPHGWSQLGVLVSINQGGDGTPRTATYRITAPGGTWGTADNGAYVVVMQPEQVKDDAGHAVQGAAIGSFNAAIFAEVTTKGKLQVKGSEGADAISLSSKGNSVTVKVNGKKQTFSLSAIKTRQAALFGYGSNDVIAVTGSLRSYLDGGDGNDKLTGGDERDTLVGGRGRDTLAGGKGADTADYSARTRAVSVTLDKTANDGEKGEGDLVQTDVENVKGGAGSDTIVGSSAANDLRGGKGDDVIKGGAGHDTLYGEDGKDQLFGDDGDDILYARDSAADRLFGGAGKKDAAQTDKKDKVKEVETLLK